MSWQYVTELIENILVSQTGIPHLTVGHLAMLFIGMMISAIIFRYGNAQKEDAGPVKSESISAAVLTMDGPEVEMPAPAEALAPDVASAIGLALHLFTNGGKNLRLSDPGMKAAAIGLALHLSSGCKTLCQSDKGMKAAAIGLAMHLQKTSGAEI